MSTNVFVMHQLKKNL